MNTVKLQITIELETHGDTEAEELGWILNLLRNELSRARNWKGRVKGVRFSPTSEPCQTPLAQVTGAQTPSPRDSARA